MGTTLGNLVYRIKAKNDDFNRKINETENKLQSFQRKAQTVGKVLTGVGVAIGAVAFKFAEVAGEAEDTVGKFEAVFKDMEDDATAFVQHFSSEFDMAESSIQEWLATLKDTFDPLGIANDRSLEWGETLTALALDVKTFYPSINSVNDAINRFTSYLVGNHEAVREMGVVVNEAMIKNKAYEMGLANVGEELSEVQKMTARYELLLNGLQNAQGNATRELDNFNMKLTQVKEVGREVVEEYGEEVLPIFADLLELGKNLLKWFRDLPDGMQSVIAKGTVFAGIISGVVGPLALIVGYLPQISSGLTLLAGSFGPFAVGAGIVTGLIAIVGALVDIRNETRLLTSDVNELTKAQLKERKATLEAKKARIEELIARGGEEGSILGQKLSLQLAERRLQTVNENLAETNKQIEELNNKEKPDIIPEPDSDSGEGTTITDFEKDMAAFEHSVAMGNVSMENQIETLEEFIDKKDEYKLKTEDVWALEERVHRLRSQLQQETFQEAIDNYNRLTETAEISATERIGLLEDIKARHAETADQKQEISDMIVRIERKNADKIADLRESVYLANKKGLEKELEQIRINKEEALKAFEEGSEGWNLVTEKYNKKRSDLMNEYYAEQEQLLKELQNERELLLKEGYEKELVLIRQQRESKLTELEQEYEDGVLLEQEYEQQRKAIKDLYRMKEKQAEEEHQKEQKAQRRAHMKRLVEINKLSLQSYIDTLNQQIDETEKNSDEQLSIKEDLYKAQVKLAENTIGEITTGLEAEDVKIVDLEKAITELQKSKTEFKDNEEAAMLFSNQISNLEEKIDNLTIEKMDQELANLKYQFNKTGEGINEYKEALQEAIEQVEEGSSKWRSLDRELTRVNAQMAKQEISDFTSEITIESDQADINKTITNLENLKEKYNGNKQAIEAINKALVDMKNRIADIEVEKTNQKLKDLRESFLYPYGINQEEYKKALNNMLAEAEEGSEIQSYLIRQLSELYREDYGGAIEEVIAESKKLNISEKERYDFVISKLRLMADDMKGNIKNQDLRLEVLKLITQEIERQKQLSESYKPPQVPERQQMRVQYQLGEISGERYTQFLKEKMTELEEHGLKYSSDWESIYNAIQGIKEEAPEGFFKEIQDKFLNKLGQAGDIALKLISGDWLGAIMELITSTESFQELMELTADVLGVLVEIFDSIFGPIIKAIAKAIRVFWNALMDILSLIPFVNMDKYKIDDPDKDDKKPGDDREPRGAGTTVSYVSGSFRDELKDLLRPLVALSQLPMYAENFAANINVLPGKLDQIIANTIDIRDILQNTNMNKINLAGAGLEVIEVVFRNNTFNENYTVEDALNDLEERLGGKVKNKKRALGRGRNN